MGTGYTRNDTGNNIADGNIINASDLDGEFDAVESAFNSSTGHTHDGTSAEGGPITKVGPVQDLVVSATAVTPKTDNTLDLGSASLEFKDGFFDGTVNIDSLVADTADINGGSVDGVTIGTNSAVTDLRVDNIKVDGNTISSTDTNGNIALAPDGTGVVALSSTDLTFGDNDKAIFGAGSDLQVFHDATDSHVVTTNGDLNLQVAGAGTINLGDQFGNTLLKVVDNADVKLYHGTTPSEKLATTATGIDVTGNATFDDNGKAIFGAGNDLQIYHDGSNSYITEGGDQTGDLFVRASNLKLTNASGDFFLWGRNADSVRLYHNNAQKLETTATGIDVTGTAVTDGLTVAGNVSVDGGTIKLDGNYPTGNFNTALGDTALDSITDGSGNVAVGHAAVTALTSGTLNTGVGYIALDANTTGGTNTAVGAGSLASNTTASNNTAVGYQALTANTTGTENVAIGKDALASNQTGGYNIAVGVDALQAYTSNHAVAIGRQALENSTTGGGIAIGSQALEANTTGTSNIAIGFNAGKSITTGANNVSIGDYALDANTTASNNTAVGNAALTANTTGYSNTALGTSALVANTTGRDNTAIGHGALDANTDAINNIAVGKNALGVNTTGDNNTALGTAALDANTTASNNVAVGTAALGANTTGTQNTAVGKDALESNTTANNNVAVGLNALAANTTGADNTSVGTSALAANTTASNNTALGRSALNANTTGTQNTAVGSKALDSTTTSNNNSAFGYNSLTTNTTGRGNTAVGDEALGDNTTSDFSTAVGYLALSNSTGEKNTCIGTSSGDQITTGTKNSILGRYNGNQGSLDIRTSSNNIVLSDGDGNPRLHWNGSNWRFKDFNLEIGGNSASSVYRATHSTAAGIHFSVPGVLPADNGGNPVDNTQPFGAGGHRWTTIFATTGSINTSDQNEKQDIESLSDAELRVATAIKGLVKKFRWRDAVEAKGNNARTHVGVIAQEVQAAFQAEGLNAADYALFCSDTWYEVDGKAVDDDGNWHTAKTEGAVEVTRLGVRYDQLLSFVIASM